jgi:hypothetical protein
MHHGIVTTPPLGLAVNCPYQASVQTPKLAQIYVYIIKTNLAETLVFRKMQSSFSDRLRRCIVIFA